MGIPRSSTIFSTAKRIFDEVHGYVELSEAELKLIDTSIFQRLRYIKQLAVAWYVYPGATHTRFSHSIGTMYIMGLIAERLLNLGYIHSKEDVQLLRIAALLHDLGHTPFSHAIEPYYRERIGIGHEDITKMLILDNPEIKETLSYYGYDPKEIVAILEGKHREPLYNQLVSSDLDVDRMDYLLRDALHTGVAYGTIDIHRLITTIVVDGEGNLAVLDKGIDALENFYIARLHMYRTVYYHKTLVGYELLLRKIYEKLAYEYSDELLLVSRAEVLNAIRSGIISFWNDSWLIGLIINALRDTGVSNMTKKLIRSFLIRRGYKVLLDKSRFEFKPLYIESDKDIVVMKDIIRELYNHIDLDEASIFVDDIKIIDEDPQIAPHIIIRGEKSEPITNIENTIIKSLPKRFHVKRLYVLDDQYLIAREVLSRVLKC